MLTTFNVNSSLGIAILHSIYLYLPNQLVKRDATDNIAFLSSLDKLVNSLRLYKYLVDKDNSIVCCVRVIS